MVERAAVDQPGAALDQENGRGRTLDRRRSAVFSGRDVAGMASCRKPRMSFEGLGPFAYVKRAFASSCALHGIVLVDRYRDAQD